jgi:hypothetical protein
MGNKQDHMGAVSWIDRYWIPGKRDPRQSWRDLPDRTVRLAVLSKRSTRHRDCGGLGDQSRGRRIAPTGDQGERQAQRYQPSVPHHLVLAFRR